jgi:hypothetical protein
MAMSLSLARQPAPAISAALEAALALAPGVAPDKQREHQHVIRDSLIVAETALPEHASAGFRARYKAAFPFVDLPPKKAPCFPS